MDSPASRIGLAWLGLASSSFAGRPSLRYGERAAFAGRLARRPRLRARHDLRRLLPRLIRARGTATAEPASLTCVV
jgi:hypothetical protein